jgi:bifunctional DNA-binding transcriptional regulator/antitoxin component of YhaV-PrlF toxin-antitoxin module
MVSLLEVIEVADKYRITITRPIREVVPLKIGQKVAVLPFGDRILVQPLPDNPEEKLAELTKSMEFNRKARRKASKFLLSQI